MKETSMNRWAATLSYRMRFVIAGTMAIALLTSPSALKADDLGWNGGTATDMPFVGAPGETTWMYKTGSTTATTENPFTYNSGANIAYVGANGTPLLNTINDLGGGRVNTIQGLRVGQSNATVNLTSVGGPDLRGSGELNVNGATPLHVEYVGSGTGDFIIAGAANRTGTVTWDSTETLLVDGQLRVGQSATGTFNQNAGTVIAGRAAAASTVFAAIGNGSTGTYNLNNGALEIGAALDTATSQEVRRNFRVGAFASSKAGTGTFNLGDGVGDPGSALFTTWDDLTVGHGGGAGTLNILSDGKISQNFAALASAAGVGGADAPFVVLNGTVNQTGGIVDTDGALQIGKGTAAASYLINGSTGSLNVRALDVGDMGTLGFTLDASGVMPMVIEGDTNTAGDTAKGITFGALATLNLSSLNLYASNDTLTLINSLDPTVIPAGVFANYAQGQSVGTNSLGTTFYINYTGGVDSNDVVLQTTPVSGGANADFDEDGDVDGADFLAWQQGQGTAAGATRNQGDSNNDGAVDANDLAAWSSQFGSHAATANVGSVPEPAGMVMIAIATTALMYRRRV